MPAIGSTERTEFTAILVTHDKKHSVRQVMLVLDPVNWEHLPSKSNLSSADAATAVEIVEGVTIKARAM